MSVSQNMYNVYSDESCHLEHDKQPIMVLGAIWCPKSVARKSSKELQSLKQEFSARGKLKWTKVSKAKEKFYLKLVDYFFENKDLHFRCLVVKNKERLDHNAFNQGSHDTFYYKMYYSLLNKILDPVNCYNIYLDIKDTRSNIKIQSLKDILCNNVWDFTKQMINNIQHIHSGESELLQLTDFLIGAVSYKNRDLCENKGKLSVVSHIENNFKYPLNKTTSLFDKKFNIFIFHPSEIKK